jgi:phage replication O-like protein O
MANPQVENGHTEVANELLEAIIKTPMSDYEHRIFWLIIRKTYGYKKKFDWISQKQIVEGTGILKQHVCRTVKKLIEKEMIVKDGKHLSIQKDYEQWKLPKQVTIKVTNTGNQSNLNRLQELPKQVTKSNLNRGTQKKERKYTKETITKESRTDNKVPYKEIKDLFNDTCKSLPSIVVLSDTRKNQIRQRWGKFKKIELWQDLFERAEESEFLSGRSGKWGGCCFDWLIKETNMIKVLEGNYDNDRSKTTKYANRT